FVEIHNINLYLLWEMRCFNEGKSMFELNFYHIKDIWFYLLSAFTIEILAGYIWQYRQSKGALTLAAALLTRAIWLLSLVVISTAEDLESKLLGVTIQQMMAALPALWWLIFVLQITNRGHLLNRRTLAALLLVPALSYFLLFTDTWHGLYWKKISLTGQVLTFTRGMGNWLMVGYNYVLLLPIIYISCQWIKQCTGLRRRQAVIVTLAPVCGGAGPTIWLFFQHSDMVSLLPLTSLITCSVWTYGLFYLRVIKLLPLAQAKAVDIVGNGLAVIDNEGWLVDLNAAAADLLGVTPGQAEGKQTAEVFAKWPSLAALLKAKQGAMHEICLEKDNHINYYELHIITLSDRSGNSLGKAFIWKEITAQKKVQERLIEQEKALSIMTERNRIGRDFHDGPAQLGSYLQMELHTILILLAKERQKDAKAHVQRLLEFAGNFNEEVRETIADLKAGVPSSQDFLRPLTDYLERYQKNYGIKTELVLPPEPLDRFLEPMIALQVLWIVQEAANNVRKHAQAKKVLVKIEVADATAVVIIADDGLGFDLSLKCVGQNHYGLAIMRERAAEAGGKVRFESKPGAGTKVIIEIPLGKVEYNEGIVG
ncbi:MAG: histidine kinase, partial [Pelosinus sp.]|nr:histidine kinase [Pelosinus sp.]